MRRPPRQRKSGWTLRFSVNVSSECWQTSKFVRIRDCFIILYVNLRVKVTNEEMFENEAFSNFYDSSVNMISKATLYSLKRLSANNMCSIVHIHLF